jgi:hypothetical protein
MLVVFIGTDMAQLLDLRSPVSVLNTFEPRRNWTRNRLTFGIRPDEGEVRNRFLFKFLVELRDTII